MTFRQAGEKDVSTLHKTSFELATDVGATSGWHTCGSHRPGSYRTIEALVRPFTSAVDIWYPRVLVPDQNLDCG